MNTLIKFLWAFLPSLTVGVVLAAHNRNQKHRDDKAMHEFRAFEQKQLTRVAAE